MWYISHLSIFSCRLVQTICVKNKSHLFLPNSHMQWTQREKNKPQAKGNWIVSVKVRLQGEARERRRELHWVTGQTGPKIRTQRADPVATPKSGPHRSHRGQRRKCQGPRASSWLVEPGKDGKKADPGRKEVATSSSWHTNLYVPTKPILNDLLVLWNTEKEQVRLHWMYFIFSLTQYMKILSFRCLHSIFHTKCSRSGVCFTARLHPASPISGPLGPLWLLASVSDSTGSEKTILNMLALKCFVCVFFFSFPFSFFQTCWIG